MAHFLVVGDAAVDQMYFVSEFPEQGGEVPSTRALMEPGGAGGTVATVLARLGNPTRIATRLGTGPFAQLALRNLVDAGVDTSLVQHDPEHQTASVTLIITPDAQRTMISASGSSRHLDAGELNEEEDIGKATHRLYCGLFGFEDNEYGPWHLWVVREGLHHYQRPHVFLGYCTGRNDVLAQLRFGGACNALADALRHLDNDSAEPLFGVG